MRGVTRPFAGSVRCAGQAGQLRGGFIRTITVAAFLLKQWRAAPMGPENPVIDFPIMTQTGKGDRAFILQCRELVRAHCGTYNYLEVGSFLGGTLTPFLQDPACRMVFSIDDRDKQHPDERGIKYDYRGITSGHMLQFLLQNGIPIDKLQTHDFSIETLTDRPERYDLAFVDGEHTDVACFRDFIHVLGLMNPTSVVMFHDSALVYKGLQVVKVYVEKLKLRHTLLKKAGSDMSALLLGDLAGTDVSTWGDFEDFAEFCAAAETQRLENLLKNRVASDSPMTIVPAPVHRGF